MWCQAGHQKSKLDFPENQLCDVIMRLNYLFLSYLKPAHAVVIDKILPLDGSKIKNIGLYDSSILVRCWLMRVETSNKTLALLSCLPLLLHIIGWVYMHPNISIRMKLEKQTEWKCPM